MAIATLLLSFKMAEFLLLEVYAIKRLSPIYDSILNVITFTMSSCVFWGADTAPTLGYGVPRPCRTPRALRPSRGAPKLRTLRPERQGSVAQAAGSLQLTQLVKLKICNCVINCVSFCLQLYLDSKLKKMMC